MTPNVRSIHCPVLGVHFYVYGWCMACKTFMPMTQAEAEKAYDDAPEAEISDEKIKQMLADILRRIQEEEGRSR
jgi:hypothetical protein